MDYHRLNEVNRKDAYPLPWTDMTLDMLVGAWWISTLDLVSGYWQVEVADGGQEQELLFVQRRAFSSLKSCPLGFVMPLRHSSVP